MGVIIFKSERKELRLICYPWGQTACSTDWMLSKFSLLRSLISEIPSLFLSKNSSTLWLPFTLPHARFPLSYFPTHRKKDIRTTWRILFMSDNCQNGDLIKKQLTICLKMMCLSTYTHVYLTKNKLTGNSLLYCWPNLSSDFIFLW